MVVAGGKEAPSEGGWESCRKGAGEGEGARASARAATSPKYYATLEKPTFCFLSWRGGSVQISDLGNYVPRMN